jgi:hypothetical protein
VEGLRTKLRNNNFLDFASDHDIIGVAESWARQEVFEIHGFINYSKGRLRTARYGRNPEGLAIFVREGISRLIVDIPTVMKELIWVGVKERESAQVKICIGFVYNAPQSSKWCNPNFTRDLEEEIGRFREQFPNTEFIIMGDVNSRIGTMQINLLSAK